VLSDLGLPTPDAQNQNRYPKAVLTKPFTQAQRYRCGHIPYWRDSYICGINQKKRQAQQRVVQMILPENFDDAVPEILLEGARNDAG
jgi:hypothetical protein